MIEYFPMYYEYRRTLAHLTDKQFGRVVRVALAYAKCKSMGSEVKVIGLDIIEEDAFNIIRADIDNFMKKPRRR
ncbi:MAG: hypothetical protein II779_07405 [Clostridia bacterium]|nr:hypothetical protein [Clostridia bacterium]